MGMFDDLLGRDKDADKDEMRENIDKIREKVQEGQPAGDRLEGPVEDRPPEPPVRPEDVQEDRTDTERPPAKRAQGGTQDEPRAPAAPERRQGGGGPEPESRGPTREDIPEPPELKDLDVPDIEKGPLFITVDKFRDALHAIADMRRVARDMEDYIGSMEGTLHEDRETEEGIRHVLDEAEADAENLKDIVSP